MLLETFICAKFARFIPNTATDGGRIAEESPMEKPVSQDTVSMVKVFLPFFAYFPRRQIILSSSPWARPGQSSGINRIHQ
jgi:hypothetical protein